MMKYIHQFDSRLGRVRIVLVLTLFAMIWGGHAKAQVKPTSTWSAYHSSNSMINEYPVPVGTTIQAYDPQGILCGEFVITEEGRYGYLYVYGDDMTTPDEDEGAEPGDTISFTIDGVDAEVSETAVWVSGTPGGIFEIDLAITILVLPSAPTLLLPVDSASIESDSVQFAWASSGPAVTNYWFELSSDPDFTSSTVDSALTLSDTVKIVSGLNVDQSYWWRVRAKNITGWGGFSNVRNFIMKTVGVNDDMEMPIKFTLEQNFPNPFNPSTSIVYSLPKERVVIVSVYSLSGELIDRLVEERQPAGMYRVVWNAANVSSGIYFYRLQVEDFIQTKKMVLLK